MPLPEALPSPETIRIVLMALALMIGVTALMKAVVTLPRRAPRRGGFR